MTFEELTDRTVHDDALMLLAKHIAVEPPWTALRVKGSVAISGVEGSLPAELILQNLTRQH